jgi:hypothetical protein
VAPDERRPSSLPVRRLLPNDLSLRGGRVRWGSPRLDEPDRRLNELGAGWDRRRVLQRRLRSGLALRRRRRIWECDCLHRSDGRRVGLASGHGGWDAGWAHRCLLRVRSTLRCRGRRQPCLQLSRPDRRRSCLAPRKAGALPDRGLLRFGVLLCGGHRVRPRLHVDRSGRWLRLVVERKAGWG